MRSANTATTRELIKACRADMPTIGIEVHGAEQVEKHQIEGIMGHGTKVDEEHEKGVKTLGETGG